MRRIIIIFAVLVVIIGGLAIYNKYKKPDDNTPTGTGTFFPTGSETTPDITPVGQVGNPDQNNTSGQPQAPSSFKQVSSRPVAGYTIFKKQTVTTIPPTTKGAKATQQTTTDSILRYVSRSSGYVYEIKNGGNPLQISNIYIPNIYEAYFADNNSTALLRFLRADQKTIATYSVPIPEPNPDGTRTQKEGTYLLDNIYSLVVSPDTKQIATLTTQSGNGIVSVSNSAGASSKRIITTPFKDWLLSWPKQNGIYLQTKASGTAQGFLYLIDQASGALRRSLGNIAGLTTSISPNISYILYSQSTQDGFTLKTYTTSNNTQGNVGISVLPEKCVWLKDESAICAGNSSVPEGTYPDVWYAGVNHFSDRLYKIYPKNGLYDELISGGNFDMTNLQIDEDNNILYFIDKSTGILWRVSL